MIKLRGCLGLLGQHTWTRWEDKDNYIRYAEGQKIGRPVLMQERRCILCNLCERHIVDPGKGC